MSFYVKFISLYTPYLPEFPLWWKVLLAITKRLCISHWIEEMSVQITSLNHPSNHLNIPMPILASSLYYSGELLDIRHCNKTSNQIVFTNAR